MSKHGPRKNPFTSSKKRTMNENTSMSEEAKVGLADEAIAIVSSGQKDRVKSRERFRKKFGKSTAITATFTLTLLLSPIPMNRPTH